MGVRKAKIERRISLSVTAALSTYRAVMEKVYFDVEADSTVDNVIEPSDHADPRDPDNVLDPILAGSMNMLTSGL